MANMKPTKERDKTKKPQEPTSNTVGPKEQRWYTHSTGAILTQTPLQFNQSKTEEFEGTGLLNLTVHHIWGELHDETMEDKSIEAFADRVLKPLVDEETGDKYTTEEGAKVVRTVLQKLKKLGYVHSYPE
jgi:hypothetical protein